MQDFVHQQYEPLVLKPFWVTTRFLFEEMDQKMTELYEATKAATKSAASEAGSRGFRVLGFWGLGL